MQQESDRLRVLRESFHLKQEEFGKPIGLSSKTISSMEVGTSGISNQTKLLLEKVYRVSIPWLETGEGDMIKPLYADNALIDSLMEADRETIELVRYILNNNNPEAIHIIKEIVNRIFYSFSSTKTIFYSN